jgi:tRNA modification GTPase
LLVTNARHKKHLQQTLADLEKALDGIKAGMTMDVVSIDIKSAAENLGYITGHQVSEEIVTNIFERFCIGK